MIKGLRMTCKNNIPTDACSAEEAVSLLIHSPLKVIAQIVAQFGDVFTRAMTTATIGA